MLELMVLVMVIMLRVVVSGGILTESSADGTKQKADKKQGKLCCQNFNHVYMYIHVHLLCDCFITYRVYANRTHDPITTRKFNSRYCFYSIRTEAIVCNYFYESN